MKGIYVTLSWRSCISQKQFKKGFATIPINPVSLASHSTTSETNQVQKNAKTKHEKTNLRPIHLPSQIYIAKQINLRVNRQ